MTASLPDGYSGETDTTPDETIEEGMQGATGQMDANGLDPDADAEERLSELKTNLGQQGGVKES